MSDQTMAASMPNFDAVSTAATQVFSPSVALASDWASIMEEEDVSSAHHEDQMSINSSEVSSNADEVTESITPLTAFSSNADLTIPRFNTKNERPSTLVLALDPAYPKESDLYTNMTCSRWLDQCDTLPRLRGLNLEIQDCNTATWAKYVLEIDCNEWDGEDLEIDEDIDDGKLGCRDTKQTVNFVSPDLRQYIPVDDEDEYTRVLCELEPQLQDSTRGEEFARGIVDWFYMCEASRKLRAASTGFRQTLQEADRSLHWFWGPNANCGLQPFDPREIRGSKVLPVREENPPEKHHLNFCHEPVYHKSATPPEVSLWAAFSDTSKHRLDAPTRHRVVASQAGKLLDPFNYTGPVELLGLRGTELHDAVTGYVAKVYTGEGRWMSDEYGIDEEVPKTIYEVEGWFDADCRVTSPPTSYIITAERDGDCIVNDDGRLHSAFFDNSKTLHPRSKLCIMQSANIEVDTSPCHLERRSQPAQLEQVIGLAHGPIKVIPDLMVKTSNIRARTQDQPSDGPKIISGKFKEGCARLDRTESKLNFLAQWSEEPEQMFKLHGATGRIDARKHRTDITDYDYTRPSQLNEAGGAITDQEHTSGETVEGLSEACESKEKNPRALSDESDERLTVNHFPENLSLSPFNGKAKLEDETILEIPHVVHKIKSEVEQQVPSNSCRSSALEPPLSSGGHPALSAILQNEEEWATSSNPNQELPMSIRDSICIESPSHKADGTGGESSYEIPAQLQNVAQEIAATPSPWDGNLSGIQTPSKVSRDEHKLNSVTPSEKPHDSPNTITFELMSGEELERSKAIDDSPPTTKVPADTTDVNVETASCAIDATPLTKSLQSEIKNPSSEELLEGYASSNTQKCSVSKRTESLHSGSDQSSESATSLPYAKYTDVSEIPAPQLSFNEYLFGTLAICLGRKALSLKGRLSMSLQRTITA